MNRRSFLTLVGISPFLGFFQSGNVTTIYTRRFPERAFPMIRNIFDYMGASIYWVEKCDHLMVREITFSLPKNTTYDEFIDRIPDYIERL